MKKLINLSDNLVHYNGNTPTEDFLASRLCIRSIIVSIFRAVTRLSNLPHVFFYAKQKFIKYRREVTLSIKLFVKDRRFLRSFESQKNK